MVIFGPNSAMRQIARNALIGKPRELGIVWGMKFRFLKLFEFFSIFLSEIFWGGVHRYEVVVQCTQKGQISKYISSFKKRATPSLPTFLGRPRGQKKTLRTKYSEAASKIQAVRFFPVKITIFRVL